MGITHDLSLERVSTLRTEQQNEGVAFKSCMNDMAIYDMAK